jgi:rhodanese-related sulfurtransferase
MRTELENNNRRDINAILAGGAAIIAVSGYFAWHSLHSPSSENAAQSVSSTASSDAAAQQKSIPTIDAETLQKKILLDKNAYQLIDIRPSSDYATEHAKGSISLSVSQLGNFSPNQGQTIVIIFDPNDIQTFEAAKNILLTKSAPSLFVKGGFDAWKSVTSQTITSGDPNSFVDQSKVTYISVEEFKTVLSDPESRITILDTQTADEFSKKHIRGALNIPLDDLEKRIQDLPVAKTIIVYGADELASFKAGVRLTDIGVFGAKTLVGNTILTDASGLPLE